MGGALAKVGGTAMNDDDLLFSVDDLKCWKKRETPGDWLGKQQDLLLERMRACVAQLDQTPEIHFDPQSGPIGLSTPPSS